MIESRKLLIILVLSLIIGGVILFFSAPYLFFDSEEGITDVNVDINNSNNSVTLIYVSKVQAEYVTVFLGGWNSTAKIRLNDTGDRAILGAEDIYLSGDASVLARPDDFPQEGDIIGVTVTRHTNERETVILTKEDGF